MNKYTLAVVYLLIGANVACAGEDYGIKVVNKSVVGNLRLEGIGVYVKGSLGSVCAWDTHVDMDESEYILSKGESKQILCVADASERRRRVFVRAACTNNAHVLQYFPRDKKWYGKDHLIKQNNRYVINIKQSDC